MQTGIYKPVPVRRTPSQKTAFLGSLSTHRGTHTRANTRTLPLRHATKQCHHKIMGFRPRINRPMGFVDERGLRLGGGSEPCLFVSGVERMRGSNDDVTAVGECLGCVNVPQSGGKATGNRECRRFVPEGSGGGENPELFELLGDLGSECVARGPTRTAVSDSSQRTGQLLCRFCRCRRHDNGRVSGSLRGSVAMHRVDGTNLRLPESGSGPEVSIRR